MELTGRNVQQSLTGDGNGTHGFFCFSAACYGGFLSLYGLNRDFCRRAGAWGLKQKVEDGAYPMNQGAHTPICGLKVSFSEGKAIQEVPFSEEGCSRDYCMQGLSLSVNPAASLSYPVEG